MDPSILMSSAALFAAFAALWKGGAWYGEYVEHRKTLDAQQGVNTLLASTFVTRHELELREANTNQKLDQIVLAVAEIKSDVTAIRRDVKQ